MTSIQAGDHFVTLGGLKLHYAVRGNGPPIIVHAPGWGVSINLYKPAFEFLEQYRTVIYFEPRGNGQSERPGCPGKMSTLHMVHDLELFRQHLGLEQLSLIGHSAGGATALGYSIVYPSRVKDMLLINSRVIGLSPRDISKNPIGRLVVERNSQNDVDFQQLLLDAMPFFLFDPDTTLPILRRIWTDPTSLWAFRGLYGSDATDPVWIQHEELDKVRARTCIIVGQDDRVCTPEMSEVLRQGIHNSSMTVIPQCGHFPWLETTKLFQETVDRFLGEGIKD